MSKINYFFFFIFILPGTSLFSQSDFEVPENIELTTAEDYANYENDIIAAADWLEETDLTKETAKRQKVNAFVLTWVLGSPSVSIDLTTGLGKLWKKNSELMMIYMASYSKYCLQHDSASKYNAAKAGITSIINVYKKGKGIKKNKTLAKLEKMTDAELTAYIKENIF